MSDRVEEFENICWDQIKILAQINYAISVQSKFTLKDLKRVDGNMRLMIKLFGQV